MLLCELAQVCGKITILTSDVREMESLPAPSVVSVKENVETPAILIFSAELTTVDERSGLSPSHQDMLSEYIGRRATLITMVYR